MKESKEKSPERDSKASIWTDPDLAELLFLSEENRTNEVVEPHEAEVEDEIIIDTPDEQDPEMAHALYYDELEPRLKLALKGVSTEAKNYIRIQKRMLLNDGHKRRRDGRQAYYYRIQQAIDIIDRWNKLCATNQVPLTESKTFRLYCMFKEAVDAIVEKSKTEGKK